MLENFKFHWINESEIKQTEDEIMIYAPAGSEYFNIPIPENGKLPEPIKTAPIYYTEIEGDFVIRAKVSHEFEYDFDAASVMVIVNPDCWGKAAFELSDFKEHVVVSAVTNGVTDDANGVNIEGNEVWFQVARVGNCFAMHYSTDGENFYMMRLFTLPAEESIKVALEAQSPCGKGGKRYYRNVSIEKKTLKDLRAGK